MVILFIGEEYHVASPTSKLANNLGTLGCRCVFSSAQPRHTRLGRLALLQGIDAMIVQVYQGPGGWILRQCAVATVLGKTLVRHWAGSDVLACLESPAVKAMAVELDSLGVLNITPATWLAEELLSIGIRAEVYPQVVNHPPKGDLRPDPVPLPLTVLVYLPSHRRAFHGGEIVRQVIERNPDIQFIIVADTEHSLASFPNVESLGWVSQMDEVWPRIGCILRITKHDGWPRMILEALARGKYAISQLAIAGCWQANDADEVHRHLDHFRVARSSPNAEGLENAEKILAARGPDRILEMIVARRRTTRMSQRLRGLAMASRLTLRRGGRS